MVHEKLLLLKGLMSILAQKKSCSQTHISYKLASVIVNCKHQLGVFKTLIDLTKIHLIDSLKFRKIVSYLTNDENNSVSRTY